MAAPSKFQQFPLPSLSLYRDIVEGCADAIVVIDSNQIIQFVNRSAETMFGRHRAGLLGQPLNILIPPRFQRLHQDQLQEFRSGNEVSRFMGQRNATIYGIRKNGEEFPAHISIAKSESENGLNLIAIVRDISEQKRLEESLKKFASTVMFHTSDRS